MSTRWSPSTYTGEQRGGGLARWYADNRNTVLLVAAGIVLAGCIAGIVLIFTLPTAASDNDPPPTSSPPPSTSPPPPATTEPPPPPPATNDATTVNAVEVTGVTPVTALPRAVAPLVARYVRLQYAEPAVTNAQLGVRTQSGLLVQFSDTTQVDLGAPQIVTRIQMQHSQTSPRDRFVPIRVQLVEDDGATVVYEEPLIVPVQFKIIELDVPPAYRALTWDPTNLSMDESVLHTQWPAKEEYPLWAL